MDLDRVQIDRSRNAYPHETDISVTNWSSRVVAVMEVDIFNRKTYAFHGFKGNVCIKLKRDSKP